MKTAQNGNPAVIRAIVRDLKNYIHNNADRAIPVGYSAADVRDVLEDTWAYLQCALDGDDKDMSRSDFFGLNSYSWCGDSDFKTAGYDTLATMFANTTVPVFFSEFGCNDPTPRRFDEVQALYGPEMTVLSGGLVYEWSQEPSNYGLAEIYSNASIQLLGDYDTLQSQYNKLNITLLEAHNSTATGLTPPSCDPSLISSDGFATNFDIPNPPQGADQVISSGISNPPTGAIVPVKETSVTLPVYGANGDLIKDLAISATNGSNTPSGDDSGSGTSSSHKSVRSTSNDASSTSTGGASSATGTSGSSSAATTTQSGDATTSATGSAATASAGAANVVSGPGGNGALAMMLGAFVLAL